MQKRWSNWEISKAASWAVQIGKNYLILGSWSSHPLVILSIKCTKLILIINNELFASVIMNRENKKKHRTFMMQKCWLSLNISSEICFGSIKKYIHKYIFLVFELQISLGRLESATKQMYTLKFCLIQEVKFIFKKIHQKKTHRDAQQEQSPLKKRKPAALGKYFNKRSTHWNITPSPCWYADAYQQIAITFFSRWGKKKAKRKW